ncbi:MAG: fumarylacetoacetate hydrolase family protein [Chloroflexi bacterium]|nr:fumarylacetoacetate hydrolase family protein [Chloroflexota bacterium]
MRYVTYERQGGKAVGIVDSLNGLVIEPTSLDWPGDMITLIKRGSVKQNPFGNSLPLEEVKLLAPILNPSKNIICIGRNYREHISEFAKVSQTEDKPPEVPVFFTKAPTAIIGHGQAITFNPKISEKIDWEGELAVIIGRQGRDISEEVALDYIFGYTCLNDVTARDLQKSHNQWFKGKSFDTFAPLGPWIVTADEIGDPQNLRLVLRVNGVTKQEGHTKDMIFTIRQIIASLSSGFTLEPGDIIATGTPSGVGFARFPPEFLKNGDVVEVEIEKIGVLRNGVISLS